MEDGLAPTKKGKGKKEKKTKKEKEPKETTNRETKKSKDSELEHLEIKRKAIVIKNRWTAKLQELDQDITLALSRAAHFEDCTESLDKKLGLTNICTCNLPSAVKYKSQDLCLNPEVGRIGQGSV